MSGIYGYVLNSKLQNTIPNTTRLSLWNAAYGKEFFFEMKKPEYVVGCYTERLKDHAPKGEGIWIRNKKVWTIDSVIYNRVELETLITGKNADVASSIDELIDEEIIICLVELYGWNILARINGDFAGAVIDQTDDSITLFRDHMGVRPLYYYLSDKELCFSTDIRGILSVKTVDVSISKEWLYNTYYDFIDYSDISTEYEKIFCVRPASVLKIAFCAQVTGNKTNGKKTYKHINLLNTWNRYIETLSSVQLNEQKYWELGSKKIRYKTDEEYVKKMRELVEDSVRIRLEAFDGIAGAELSGGLDSSLISILIHKMGRECKYVSWSLDPKIHPLQEEDERNTIEEICKRDDISCKYVGKKTDFSIGREFEKNYSKVVDVKNDRPVYEKFAFWPAINTFPLFSSSNYVHECGGKVVFTGHGGDEGVSHRTNAFEMWVNREYGNYFNYFMKQCGCKNCKTLRAMKRSILFLLRMERKRFRDRKKRTVSGSYWKIINPQFMEQCVNISPIPLYFSLDPKKYILFGGSRLRMDNVAMYGAYNSVRYMLPYLDFRVIDYAVSIERYMYLKNGNDRYILKKAFEDILPDSLKGRIDKSDPSYAGVSLSDESMEEKIERIKKLLNEYTYLFDEAEYNGIFSAREILDEIESKQITAENYMELAIKTEKYFWAMWAVIAIDKARCKEVN